MPSTIDTTADPVKAEEAIAYFRAKLPLTDDEFEALSEAAQARAFKVAGIAELDVVTDVWDALDKALEQGTDFADFKEQVTFALEDAWGGTVANPGWRCEVIFRTNLSSSFNAGRHKQYQEVKEDRPYLLVDTVADSRRSEICDDVAEQTQGKAIAEDDPFFVEYGWPPWHHACRSTCISLTEEQAKEYGITDGPEDVDVDEDFRGNPGMDDWSPDVEDYPDQLQEFVERLLD